MGVWVSDFRVQTLEPRVRGSEFEVESLGRGLRADKGIPRHTAGASLFRTLRGIIYIWGGTRILKIQLGFYVAPPGRKPPNTRCPPLPKGPCSYMVYTWALK